MSSAIARHEEFAGRSEHAARSIAAFFSQRCDLQTSLVMARSGDAIAIIPTTTNAKMR
jgi:hypothetical protein